MEIVIYWWQQVNYGGQNGTTCLVPQFICQITGPSEICPPRISLERSRTASLGVILQRANIWPILKVVWIHQHAKFQAIPYMHSAENSPKMQRHKILLYMQYVVIPKWIVKPIPPCGFTYPVHNDSLISSFQLCICRQGFPELTHSVMALLESWKAVVYQFHHKHLNT